MIRENVLRAPVRRLPTAKRAGAVTPSELVPGFLIEQLRACPEVAVFARPPLQGRAGILPPGIAFSFRDGERRTEGASSATRVVIAWLSTRSGQVLLSTRTVTRCGSMRRPVAKTPRMGSGIAASNVNSAAVGWRLLHAPPKNPALVNLPATTPRGVIAYAGRSALMTAVLRL